MRRLVAVALVVGLAATASGRGPKFRCLTDDQVRGIQAADPRCK